MGRIKDILYKISELLGSLLLLILICFFMTRYFPGGPFDMDESSQDPLLKKRLQELYGLSLPVYQQILLYLKNLSHGHLGQSLFYVGKTVEQVIFENGRVSLFLGGISFGLSILISFLFAVGSRLFLNVIKFDFIILLLFSIPIIVLSPLMVLFFCYQWEIFPLAFLESTRSYILPVFLMSIKPTLSLIRVLGESLDQGHHEEFSIYASASGFSHRQVIYKWILPNSLNFYLIQAASVFVGLISGSFLIEIIFSLPGLGKQFIDSLLNRDWPLVTGLTLFYGTLILAAHFSVDIISQWLNPQGVEKK